MLAVHRGFTLIEVAIVLLVISVLAGSLLVPLADSVDRARRQKVEAELQEEVLPALMAFAASRTSGTYYLPCPDCRNDGSSCTGGTAGDGIEDRDGGGCSVTYGVLPWVTLQVGHSDPWGARYSYAVFEDYAGSDSTEGIQLNEFSIPPGGHPNPDLRVETLDGGDVDANDDPLAGSEGNGIPAVIISHGPNRLGAMSVHLDEDGNGIAFAMPEAGTDEEKNTEDADDELFYWRPPTDPTTSDIEEFDDIVVWLSNHRLRAFLAEAGVLPN